MLLAYYVLVKPFSLQAAVLDIILEMFTRKQINLQEEPPDLRHSTYSYEEDPRRTEDEKTLEASGD